MYPQTRPYTGIRPSANALLGEVLGITAGGFVFTAVGAYLGQGINPGLALLLFIPSILLLFVLRAVRANPTTSLLVFAAFTFLEGLSLGPMLNQYLHLPHGAVIVQNAAMTTAVGMAVLGGLVWTTSINFRRFQGIAAIGLIGLVLVGIISMFFHIVSPTTYSWATLAVFTLLILVDFARIRSGGDGQTSVEMAVQIYLDAINVFLALLRIFGVRSDED